jgi:hypothetical protein
MNVNKKGKGRRNKFTTTVQEDGKTNTQKEEKLAVTFTEDIIRKSSQATVILPN